MAQKFVVFFLNEVVAWNRIKYPGGTPYNGQNGEAPPERDTFFSIQAYERVGISVAEVFNRAVFLYVKSPKRANRRIYD